MDDSRSYYASIIDLNTFERETRYHSICIREMARARGRFDYYIINQKSEREMFETKFPSEIESSARHQLHSGHDSCCWPHKYTTHTYKVQYVTRCDGL